MAYRLKIPDFSQTFHVLRNLVDYVWLTKNLTCCYCLQVNDLLYFFSHRSLNHEIQFIWGSAKSGYTHLYLTTVSLTASVSEQNHIQHCAGHEAETYSCKFTPWAARLLSFFSLAVCINFTWYSSAWLTFCSTKHGYTVLNERNWYCYSDFLKYHCFWNKFHSSSGKFIKNLDDEVGYRV